MAPTWESLANVFAPDPNVVIAKVDAEAENAKATAGEQEITSYPTIKFFPRGSKEPEAYKGGRTEDALIAFINEKAGTNRVAGGGLNSKAGTISTLDSIVAKYVSGENIAKVVKEIKSAAKGLQQAYAAYYVKVAEKLSNSAGYASKELARLEKILSKGGLAQEKLDDVVSRSNILRRFVGKEQQKEEL